MKVIQFAFDAADVGGSNEYLPHNYDNNCVVYTGTHDNETLVGWYKTICQEDKKLARDYLCNYHTPDGELFDVFICLAMSSVSKCCIIPIQDYMGLDNDCRINKPSTIGCNWRWRITEAQLNEQLQEKIRTLTGRYGRMNWDAVK